MSNTTSFEGFTFDADIPLQGKYLDAFAVSLGEWAQTMSIEPTGRRYKAAEIRLGNVIPRCIASLGDIRSTGLSWQQLETLKGSLYKGLVPPEVRQRPATKTIIAKAIGDYLKKTFTECMALQQGRGDEYITHALGISPEYDYSHTPRQDIQRFGFHYLEMEEEIRTRPPSGILAILRLAERDAFRIAFERAVAAQYPDMNPENLESQCEKELARISRRHEFALPAHTPSH